MDEISPPVAQAQGAPSAARDASGGTRGLGAIAFAAYLALLAIEYLGLASDLPVLKAARVATIISYSLFVLVLFRVGPTQAFSAGQTRIVAAFVVLTGLSIFWAYVQTYALNSLRPFANALGLLVVTTHVVDRAARFDRLCGLFALTAVVLVAKNLPRLASSTRTGGFLAGYFMGDGNDFAWGLNVMMPLALWLAVRPGSIITRGAGLLGACACTLGIVATQSRGGTLGLFAAMLYGLFFISRRRAVGLVAVSIALGGILVLAPSGYVDRMRSMGAYEEDSSAQGRLQVWGMSIQMALDHPLGVGAGNFNSAYGRRYLPNLEDNRIEWASGRWLSAHSIYFKVLGEYGFPGLALLAWMLISNLRDNARTRRRLAAGGAQPVLDERWPAILNMSLVAYAVSGVFLGGVAYPHLFILTGLTLATKRYVERDLGEAPQRSRPVAPRARSPQTLAGALPHGRGLQALHRRYEGR